MLKRHLETAQLRILDSESSKAGENHAQYTFVDKLLGHTLPARRQRLLPLQQILTPLSSWWMPTSQSSLNHSGYGLPPWWI
eukprot:2296901-Amphidinium_carterae.1